MNNFVSTWSPQEVILPSVENNIDYALFFVTDSGTINGLNITFVEGDWLVYIKKDGVSNWYKTNGIATFNLSGQFNTPDAGVYTKLRLDNNSNIIAADILDAGDIPHHKHKFSDIEDKDAFREEVQKILGEAFNNQSGNNSVRLVYDKTTHTISAEANVDGITVKKNVFGQLESSGSGGSSQSSSIIIEQVQDLTARLETLESLIKKQNIIVQSTSGIKEKEVDGGKILSVNVDGSSIQINAYGQLEVNPDFSTNGSGNQNNNCANHKHTLDQIPGLKELILELIEKNRYINVKDIPIDGTTIVINKKGQLSAVAAAVGKHKHVMDDITDLNKNKADVWASDQPLKGDAAIDYSSGIVDLTTFSIGFSIATLSRELKKVKEDLQYALDNVGKVIPEEPHGIEFAKVTFSYIDELQVLNIKTGNIETAGLNADIYIKYFYPWNKGKIIAVVDGKENDTLDLSDGTKVGDINNIVGPNNGVLKVIEITESYRDIKSFQGFYKSIGLMYTLPNLKAGKHKIEFIQIVNNENYRTNKIELNIYEEVSPIIEAQEIKNLTPNFYNSGILTYNGDGKYIVRLIVKNSYKGNFAPINILTVSLENESQNLKPLKYHSDGIAEYLVEYQLKESDRKKNLCFNTYNFGRHNSNTFVYSIPYVIFNNTTFDESKFRVVPTIGKLTEVPDSLDLLAEYNVEQKIPDKELVILNNFAQFNNTNYKLQDIGPDYSNQNTDGVLRWINFMFKSAYKNNIYVDLEQEDNKLFQLDKYGKLKDIAIYLGQSNTMVPQVWVDGNKPYIGNGNATNQSIGWAGLDLFRSTQKRRYITFGQGPTLDGGNIFLRIGITADVKLNCDVLIKSVLESLNG